jgi:hypothetical protein
MFPTTPIFTDISLTHEKFKIEYAVQIMKRMSEFRENIIKYIITAPLPPIPLRYCEASHTVSIELEKLSNFTQQYFGLQLDNDGSYYLGPIVVRYLSIAINNNFT